ncbi:Protein of unknown function (DUF3445) domain containing protein [Naviculisporaceae sp. PSN 640]
MSAHPQPPLPDQDVHYGDVEPHDAGFDFRKVPVTILHPYKAPYNLSFGMKVIPTSELIQMDCTYLQNLTERKEIMARYPEAVLGAIEDTHGCVEEMYRWLTSIYLPRRFPTMFQIEQGEGNTFAHIKNLVDGEMYPLDPPKDQIEALRMMGALVDEDFLFMLPSADGDGYSLAAYVNCYANGDHTKKRLHMNIRDIHAAVPGYNENLAKRVDVWFEKLEVGKIVVRENLHVCARGPQSLYSSSAPGDSNEDIEAGKLFVRSERQTLRRLPVSKAIVFSLKTYLYPISDTKAAGYGQDLIKAIDGLGTGNAPGMIEYKKSNVWGSKVKAYLQE